MINFKQREDILPSSLILFSLLLLLGTLAYMVVVPVPSAAGLAKGREHSRTELQDQITAAQKHSKQLQEAVRPHLWSDNPEQVTAQVLAKVTHETNSRSLKLGAFRPQKIETLEGLEELPFSVQIAGPFSDVEAVVAALDTSSSRVALRSVQVASQDAATSTVTATLVISAYIRTPEVTTDAPPATVATNSPARTEGVSHD